MNDYVKQIEEQNDALCGKLAFYENLLAGKFSFEDLDNVDIKFNDENKKNIIKTFVDICHGTRINIHQAMDYHREFSTGDKLEKSIYFLNLIQWASNFPYHSMVKFYKQERPVSLIKLGNSQDHAVTSTTHTHKGISSIFNTYTEQINADVCEVIKNTPEVNVETLNKDNIVALLINDQAQNTSYENVVNYIHFNFGKESNIIQHKEVEPNTLYAVMKSMYGLPIKIGIFVPFLVTNSWVSSGEPHTSGEEPCYTSRHSYASKLAEFTRKVVIK